MIDELKGQIAKFLEPNLATKTPFKQLENTLVTDDMYQRLKGDNEDLHQLNENLSNQLIKSVKELGLKNTQNEALSEQVEFLQQVQEKYEATRKALKLHL